MPAPDPPALVDVERARRFSEGREPRLAEWMGAHPARLGGVEGTTFTVWAPAATDVSVIGDGLGAPDGVDLSPVGVGGIWSTFVPAVGDGTRYHLAIRGPDGERRLKADPMAFRSDPLPGTASVVHRSSHRWTDGHWMAGRGEAPAASAPLSIYEVHVGSWRRRAGPDRPLTYRELAAQLASYVTDLGFTHVELLPVMAHPFRGSWGYQVTSYFAPSPELGAPDDLRAMIDELHRHGVGVILDWVPAHFPRDDWALAAFDGTPTYEHRDSQRGAHPDWGTLIFDYGRPEVRNFLVANAVFWAREYHADGLRVDAVASMLYRDYSRGPDEWTPNVHGGREDLEAVAFVEELNDVLHAEAPGVIVVAEESTAWPGVSRPTADGGLGFDVKWNLGWMHDTLGYFARPPEERAPHHRGLTFGLTYAFSETFLLPLSHDEVVHAKGSLVNKMPGDRRQRLANLRALLAHQWAHPGKQLLFMGGELAQEREWSHDRQLDWHLLDDAGHAGVQALVRDLNAVYRATPALWALDADPLGFSWLTIDGSGGLDPAALADCVFAYLRRGRDGDRPLACVANLAPVPYAGFRVGLPCAGRWVEVVNTDAMAYGGSGGGNPAGVTAERTAWGGQPCSAVLALPALSVLWLRPEPG